MAEYTLTVTEHQLNIIDAALSYMQSNIDDVNEAVAENFYEGDVATLRDDIEDAVNDQD
jgi:hypothetical protein